MTGRWRTVPGLTRDIVFCATCGTQLERGRCVDDGRHGRTTAMPADLYELLRTIYDRRGARVWLLGRNGLLGHERPIDLLAEGRTEEVAAVIHGLAEGVFV